MTPDAPAHPGRRVLRVGLAGLWLLDAALQAQPSHFGAAYWLDDVGGAAMAQPEAINRLVLWGARAAAPHALVVNLFAVSVEVAIGLGLLVERWWRPALAVSVVWALAVWVVGQGFGGIFTSLELLTFGAPGSALLYAALAVLAWPTKRYLERGGRWVWCGLWVGGGALVVFDCLHHPAALVWRANLGQTYYDRHGPVATVATATFGWVIHHADPVSVTLALLEVAIGLAVVAARTRRVALGAGAGLALVQWILGQDLGPILARSASDPGTGPLVILLAAGLVLVGRSVNRDGLRAVLRV